MNKHSPWIDVIRNKKLKRTDLRVWLLGFLAKIDSPQSVTDLLDNSNLQGAGVNKTTFYRELSQLIEVDLVRELDFGEGKKRYELNFGKPHHHHLICEKCRQIFCLNKEPDLTQIQQNIENENGFKISHHLLEFFGICKNCKTA